MIPILFEETETQFTSNGIGRLTDAISCKVTEERNGQYELEMVYPVTGQHFESIERYALIYATHEDGKGPQPFEIYRITRPMNGKVTVYAHHISYRLNKMVTTGGNVEAGPNKCQDALDSLVTGAILPEGQTFDFTLTSDHVATAASFKTSVPRSVRSRLLGSEGSILDQYGGTFEWDMFNVIVHPTSGQYARGRDNSGIVIRYGKNLTDIKQEYNIENTITGVIPFWQGENEVVTGTIQYSRYHEQFDRERIVSVDFTDAFENKPTVQQLNSRATIYANEHGQPDVSITVSFVDLAQTEEYKDILPLTHVHLDDEVTVQYEELGIDRTSRITKVIYDVLADRYDSIVVGELVPTFSKTITDTFSSEIASVSAKMIDAIANATAWMTSADGYVIAVKDEDGTWKELIFADAKEQENWHNLIRINNHGIGFSTDGGQSYTQAWTIDGNLLASYVNTGILKSPASNANYWNLDTGEFRLSTAVVKDPDYVKTYDSNVLAGKTYYRKINNQFVAISGHIGARIPLEVSPGEEMSGYNFPSGQYYELMEDYRYNLGISLFTFKANSQGGYDYIDQSVVHFGSLDSVWNYASRIINITRDIKTNIENLVSDINSFAAAIEATGWIYEYDSDFPANPTPGDFYYCWLANLPQVISYDMYVYAFTLPTYEDLYVYQTYTLADIAQMAEDGMPKEEIFNRLTDNGANQGMFVLENGELYLNATYIKTGELSTTRLKTENMSDVGNVVHFTSGIYTAGNVGVNGHLRVNNDARFTGTNVELGMSNIKVLTSSGWKNARSGTISGVGTFANGILVEN